mmetsp:Transcript_42014/g.97851  ORF Transcript_42014/g.97851 Transcript_42014/m.97851 type:complete len:296 (+) Transcript_42014:637-1524(+)
MNNALLNLRGELGHCTVAQLKLGSQDLSYYFQRCHLLHLNGFLVDKMYRNFHLLNLCLKLHLRELPGRILPLHLRNLAYPLNCHDLGHFHRLLLLQMDRYLLNALIVAEILLWDALVHILHDGLRHLPDYLADLYFRHLDNLLLVQDMRHFNHALNVLENRLDNLLLHILNLHLGDLPDDLPHLHFGNLDDILANLHLWDLLNPLHDLDLRPLHLALDLLHLDLGHLLHQLCAGNDRDLGDLFVYQGLRHLDRPLPKLEDGLCEGLVDLLLHDACHLLHAVHDLMLRHFDCHLFV